MEKFDLIYIMLGFKCNFDCVYCLQEEQTKEEQKVTVSEKVYEFLDKYPYKETTRLCFFGGEPLLYFPVIKEIVERYKGSYRYSVISNGSLLTKTHVDFFNKHDIHFTLSHDANITIRTRGYDVWNNPEIRQCFDELKNKSINVTVTSNSLPLKEIFAFYPDHIPLNLNYMMNVNGKIISKKLADFSNYKRYGDDIHYLLQSYDEGKWREMQNVDNLIKTLYAFMTDEDRDVRCYECVYGAKTLNIDLEGNIAFCHNSAVKVGSVEKMDKTITQKTKAIIQHTRRECTSCEYGEFCGGSCSLLKGIGKGQNCMRLKTLYKILLPWVVKKGLGTYA